MKNADRVLPPIQFTAGEAAALVALGSLAREKWGPPPPGKSSTLALSNALNKIVGALHGADPHKCGAECDEHGEEVEG